MTLLWPLLFLITSSINGLDIPDGCKVQDSLSIDPLEYDSVRFHAFARDASTIFKAEITCSDSRYYDYIRLTSNHSVVLETLDYPSLTTQGNSLKPGWNTFNLKVMEQYLLKDNHNQSWIPKGTQAKCNVTKVSLDEGLFMRHCPDGTPTWDISGSTGRCVTFSTKESDEKAEKVKMFSMKEFLPTFNVDTNEFIVGWKDGMVKVVTDGKKVHALPPFKEHIIILQVTQDAEDKQEIKISDDFGTLHHATLSEKPTDFQVKGRQGDAFVLLQKIKEHICSKEPGSRSGMSEVYQKVKADDVSSDLSAILVLTVLVVIFFFVTCVLGVREFQHHQRERKARMIRIPTATTNSMRKNMNVLTVSTLPAGLSSREETCESFYLKPFPARLPSWVPAVPEPPAKVCEEEDSNKPEPVYEEVDAVEYLAFKGKCE